MLPEHVEMLKEVFAEDEHKERPIIDEQQKMENDLLLQSALNNDLTVEITYFEAHDFHQIKGSILFIDTLGGLIRLDDMDLFINDIIEIDIV